MLLTQKFVKGFQIHLKIQQFLGTYPFFFNRDSSCVPKLVVASDTSIKWRWLKLAFSIILVSTLWIQVALAKETEQLVTTLESTMNVSAITVFVIHGFVYMKRIGFVVDLFNGLIQFEKERPQEFNNRPVVGMEKWVIKGFHLCGDTACPSIIGAYAVQRWLIPCTSATFAWTILPECFDDDPHHGSWSEASVLKLILLILFLTWLLADLMGGFTLQTVEISFLFGACLVNYIKEFRQSLEKFGQQKPKLMFQYRQLQILARIYNWIQQDAIVVATLNLVLLLIIICLYTLILIGPEMSFAHLIFFVGAFMNALATILICFGTFAAVNTQSTLTLEFLKTKLLPQLERNKTCGRCKFLLLRRYVASLYPLKV